MKENLRVLAWFRYLTDRFVVVPIASVFPARIALTVADLVGLVHGLIPGRGSRVARLETTAATGAVGWAAFRGACRRLAGPRRDLVYLRRMRSRRESLADWTLNESNPDPIHQLVASRQPFVLAGGHFSSAPSYFRHQVLPADAAFVGSELPHWKLSPSDLRRRLSAQLDYGLRSRFLGEPETLDYQIQVPDLWVQGANWSDAPDRTPSVQDAMLARLARPGGIVITLVDAYWEKSTAYRPPFVGIRERGFALGAARIARIAQCPLVPFVAVFGEEPRTVIIDWGCPIPPPEPDDAAADRRVIDQALEFIEKGVARYPDQYDYPIGCDRRWSAVTGRWEDTPEDPDP